MPDGREQASWIEFGTLSRPHGVRGEVRLVPAQRGAEWPRATVRVRLRPRLGAPRLAEVVAARSVNEAVLVRFADIADRDAAQALGGTKVDVEAQALPPVAAGELYLYELLGATVLDEQGTELGRVRQLVDNNGQDLLVLESEHGERMVPLGPDTLRRFDRETQRVILRVAPGLFEEG